MAKRYKPQTLSIHLDSPPEHDKLIEMYGSDYTSELAKLITVEKMERKMAIYFLWNKHLKNSVK